MRLIALSAVAAFNTSQDVTWPRTVESIVERIHITGGFFVPRPLALQAVVALLVMLAACTPTPALTSTPAPSVLVGTAWKLETLHGRLLIDGSTITLEFDERPGDRLSGSSGCNYYGARYQASDTAFGVSDLGSTLRGCETPAGVMAQEQAYAEALVNVSSYRLTAGRVDMANEKGDTVLVFGVQQ